jgi:hypothetical protein
VGIPRTETGNIALTMYSSTNVCFFSSAACPVLTTQIEIVAPQKQSVAYGIQFLPAI